MPSKYTLSSPVPSLVNSGVVDQSVGTSDYRLYWKDALSVFHVIQFFGGATATQENIGWTGHYLCPSTGDSRLIYGTTHGAIKRGIYYNDKFYGGDASVNGDTGGSAFELDYKTGVVTILADGTMSGTMFMFLGDDNCIYWVDYKHKVYSYDPAIGLPGGWKSYGTSVDSSYGDTFVSLVVGGGYAYAGLKSAAGVSSLFITATTGEPSWSEWEFGAAGDKQVTVGRTSGGDLFVYRKLSDDSIKYYYLTDGGYTLTGDTPVAAADVVTFGSDATLASYSGYNVNCDYAWPIKDTLEESLITYKAVASETWLESRHAYEGDWRDSIVIAVTSNGVQPICLTKDYGFGLKLNYKGAVTTYLGFQVFSPYYEFKHSSGELFFLGYSNQILRYDPTSSWTLLATNTSVYLPSDEDKPNPYFMDLSTVDNPHYSRWCGACEDKNGLLWMGGVDNGGSSDVMWYDPSDGSVGYMGFNPYPGDNGWTFHSICASGDYVCVSGDDGNIWLINVDTKTIDPVPFVPVVDAAAYSYLMTVGTDIVLGICSYTGPTYSIFRFQPSTKTALTASSLITANGAPAGVIFGFATDLNRYQRKLELGPDGYVWMFVGNIICRIHPTTCAFTQVVNVGAYAKLKFSYDGQDLMLYGVLSDFKYYPSMLIRSVIDGVDFVTTSKISGIRSRKINGILIG